MALTDTEQAYLDFARQALPRFLTAAPDEPLAAAAKMIGLTHAQIVEWLAQAYMQTASGVWLDQHGRDLGTNRREAEVDAVYRSRLNRPTLVVTRPNLLAGVDAILAAAGEPTGAAMLEMRYDRMFLS